MNKTDMTHEECQDLIDDVVTVLMMNAGQQQTLLKCFVALPLTWRRASMSDYPQVQEFEEDGLFKWQGFLEEGVVAESGEAATEQAAHGQAIKWLAGVSS